MTTETLLLKKPYFYLLIVDKIKNTWFMNNKNKKLESISKKRKNSNIINLPYWL